MGTMAAGLYAAGRSEPTPSAALSARPDRVAGSYNQRFHQRFSAQMPGTAAKIRFEARLLRPAGRSTGDSWSFLVLPKDASAKLPTRGVTTVEGIINGHSFRATLEPDGQKSHWLKVNRRMREAAGVEVGDLIPLEILSVRKEPEPRVPADLRKALAASPAARALWSDITPVARRDWIHWITSAKQSQTRARRIRNARAMLAAGKRRVCCFDRSGFYSKNFRAPEAADQTTEEAGGAHRRRTPGRRFPAAPSCTIAGVWEVVHASCMHA